ncbi:MAG: hypothetical protein U1A72_04180 [Sulfuritalea sp.]|nr:hypothetical protein [Sulfuritalea sp.]
MPIAPGGATSPRADAPGPRYECGGFGFVVGGVPAQLLDAAQVGEIELFTSRPLLAELSNILARGKFAAAIAATGLPREELVLGLPS